MSEPKNFVLRNTPAWLTTHRDWISDRARHLYGDMRKLADVRTGRLFIAGRSWISLRAIEKKCGISHNTRKKYFKELIRLGGLDVHREYVIRVIRGRKLKVLGPAQVTLLWEKSIPLFEQKPKSPHEDSVQPTDQIEKPHEQALPPTDQSAEKGHLQTNSPTVGVLVDQYLSKNTNGAAVPSHRGVNGQSVLSACSSRPVSKAPQEKPRERDCSLRSPRAEKKFPATVTDNPANRFLWRAVTELGFCIGEVRAFIEQRYPESVPLDYTTAFWPMTAIPPETLDRIWADLLTMSKGKPL